MSLLKLQMELTYKDYDQLHKASIEDKEKFWKDQSNRIDWFKKPTTILDSSNAPLYKWYSNGITNITYNCLDRHAKTNPDKTAFIYEGPIAKEQKKISYKELLELVEKFAGSLKALNLECGDTAIIYMPMVIETAVAMLACARIGVIHSVVFGGFSSKELASRIIDCKPKVIISSTCGLEPHKVVKYPDMIREAIKISKADLKVIYLNRKQNQIKLQDNEMYYYESMKEVQPQKAVELNSNHPLYILYTSGTTGQPKGIYRDHGGSAVGVMVSLDYGFGLNKDSVMFATSDFGWVVGHSYIVYGPLLMGCTSIIYEGKPVGTPDVGAYFRIVQQYKVDVLYSSPTAVRSIRKEDPKAEKIKEYDLSTLKVFGVVGERTDIHTYDYLKSIMPKDCLYNDTYWQTETGWFISANFIKPQRFSTKGGSCTKPYPGYDVKVFSDEHKDITNNKELGHVVIKLPMPPSFMLSLWGNDEQFKKKYLADFPGYYQTGDAGYFDEEGYLHILTRTDDIIQVAGHRLSTAQMEEVVLSHQSIAEAVVVGINDALKGQIPYAIIVLKKGEKIEPQELFCQIVKIVRKEIGPVACLYNFSLVEKLPKTRSGKILRGTIRKILDKEKWKMPATIEDKGALTLIQEISDSVAINRKQSIVFETMDTVNHKQIKIE